LYKKPRIETNVEEKVAKERKKNSKTKQKKRAKFQKKNFN